MAKAPQAIPSDLERRQDWRVTDTLAQDVPVTRAELDAVEAFLMPLVAALLCDERIEGSPSLSLVPKRASIHKDRVPLARKDG